MRRKPMTLGVLIAIAVVAGQALLIPLFAAPAANLAPRDLPLAVAGPPPVAAQLEAQHPGAFKITRVAARSSIPPEFRYSDYGFRCALSL